MLDTLNPSDASFAGISQAIARFTIHVFEDIPDGRNDWLASNERLHLQVAS